MQKKDVNLDGQRVRFSKKIKRKILLEISKGANAKDVLLKYAFSSFDEISADKKYAAKLLSKWRKELYQNKEVLNFLNHEIDFGAIDEEIMRLEKESEITIKLEGAFEELKDNFLKVL
ncbi:MAG: hypothetical protein IJB79_08295 [Candidatus Gastranaerophilales bacterium]|nr:hypothetical protein [Candidatus Gastranaerophilales bacterium]